MERGKDFLSFDKYKMSYAFLSAVLTAMAVLFIYSLAGRLPGGENPFLYGDLRTQYIAFAPLFWRSLFRGEGIWYTFYVSLGMPSISLYTYYSLSPFNLMYLLIDHAELASIILVVFKLSLAAYTFQRFSARVLKNDSLSSVIFSIGYALNGYCIIFYYNIHSLDGVYMLPVIFMLVAEAVKKRRYAKLTLAYAYLFAVEFYGGYIIGFFSLLFFILLMILEYKKEWQNYIRASIGFGISVVCAALISAVVLYPTAVFLLSNLSFQDNDSWSLSVQIWDIYKNMYMGQYQGDQSPYPYIYCGIMSLYLVPCFFADSRIKKIHKLLFAVLLVYLIIGSLWLPGYMFMHCFDYPDGCGFRFAFLFSFVLMSIGSLEWKHMEFKRSRELIILFIIQTALYFAVNIGGENITMNDKIINVIFLAVFLALFLLFHKYGAKKLFQGVFLGIVCLELVVNGVLIVEKPVIPWMEYRQAYQAFTSVNQRALEEIKAYDSGIYRIAQENAYYPNDTSLNGYYGLNYFSSVENSRLRQTLEALGYAVSPRTIADNGGTTLMRMLLAQKYEIVVNNVDYIQGRSGVMWEKNNYFLTLGYMVSDKIFDINIDSDNAFENQNSLASGMTGEDIRVFYPYPQEIIAVTDHLMVSEIYLDDGNKVMGIRPIGEMTEGSLTFRLKDTGVPVYAYFAQNESFMLDDAVYVESGEGDRIWIWITSVISVPRIIELVKDEEDKYYVGIYYNEIHANHNYYKESYFYCYDDNAVNRVYESLKDNQMNILEMKGSDITAEIEVPSDKQILFTTIPYDEGWHVLVDGQEVDTLAVVNDTFLAVELTEGYHELKFYYDSVVNRVGMILSVVGIVSLIAMICLEQRKNIKENNIQKVRESNG